MLCSASGGSNNFQRFRLITRTFLLAWLAMAAINVLANVPGGGTNGANVTLTDSGTTVTLANGIVSILCTKSGGTINQINYTFNNTGSSQTLNLLSGGNNGGQLYWENSNNQGLSFTYTLVANPANTGGNYAEISLSTTSVTGDVLEVHYSLLRGAAGFYTTAIWYHRSTDGAFGMGECRDNIYAGSIFNWMSVDAQRNRLMQVSGGSAIGVQGAPVEVSLWTNGIYAGQYEDKYKYSADLGVNHVWGWSSVGTGGKNVGLWNITASSEYYNGGPLKRELMSHIGTTILNMLNGGHYGMGSDGNWATNEVWTKVDGPYFIYCNNVTNTLTGTNPPALALYNDALAQAAAEAGAWPYYWFTNANYASAAKRGTVTGKIIIADSGNPNAAAAGLWVGLIQQPATTTGTYDFQQWVKPYQFWTKTDTNGNFAVNDVIAGTNYTLYAFGPGAPAMFMSQNQTGGNPPVLFDLPAAPFAVSVAGGATNNLGNVTWTPARVGATVFEIGYPNRTADKFRHGDDWWVGDIGPKPTAPSPIWSKWLEYPFDFPNGVNYVVGQSRWSTDWNFVQPVVVSSSGTYGNSSSTITFNLPSAPTNGAQASLYVGLSSDYYCAIVVTINSVNLSSISGAAGTPTTSIPATGYYTGYGGSDTTVREGNQAAASDERITFPASALHAGVNTINIAIRQSGSYFANHAMYDYLRLELAGYVPPPPASVAAYAGNNCNLVSWPVTPGATSYNLLRSTNASSGFVSITNGVTGPVCGSGGNNAMYLDLTAGNGTNYYYLVRSVNPTGSSTNSPVSASAMPSAGNLTSAPIAPTGLAVAGVAHQSVTLNWSAAAAANFYSVWRSTLVNSGGGSSNVLSTILLNNAVTNTTYTDNSPTDGSIYRYFVTATGAGGTSTNSAPVVAVPLPTTPATLPASLTGSFVQTSNITLNWLPVPGAVGYIISRATSAAGPYTFLQSVTETTYTDTGLNTNVIYYYRVAAMNAAGVSANAADLVNSQQIFPASLTATPTNTQIILSWPATTGATNYTLKRGTSSGGETYTVVTGYAGTTYTNTGLINGTTYYDVVTATGAGGTSGNSPEASATPLAIGNGIWISPASGNWSAASNWIGGGIASGSVNSADFSTLSLPTNLTVTLDSARSISSLIFGDTTAAFNWTLAGTNTLTLGIAPSIAVNNQTAAISVPLAGTNGWSKTGFGALKIGGATNNFSGDLTLVSGSVALDFSATGSPNTNLVPATNALFFGGATLQIIGSAAANNTQTFNGAELDSGNSVISAAPVSGTNLPTVNLGAITELVGGTVELLGPATINSTGTVAATAILTTTTSPGAAGILGSIGVGKNGCFATVSLYDWATTNTATTPYTIVGGSQIAGFYQTNGITTSGNYDAWTGGVNSIGNTSGANTIRFNQNAAVTVSFIANFGQNMQGVLVTPKCGAYNETLGGGGNFEFVRSTSPGNSYGVIWQNNPQGYLNCSINLTAGRQGGQYNGLVQSGTGTVVYSGANTYELGAYLNGGFSVISAYNGFGQTNNGYNSVSPVTLNGGTVVGNATFTNSQAGANARPFVLGNNGGGLTATAGKIMTVDGVISDTTGAGPLIIGIPACAANNFVAGLLPGSGPNTANTNAVFATGTVVLTAPNTFTGGTVLQSGTLNINGIYALGGANYGGLTFNGGTLQYAANFPGNNGSADLTSIGTAGIQIAAGGGTIDVNGNSITYAGSIGNNSTGALTVKSSLAGGVLNLQNASNYSGNTSVTNATLAVNNTTGSATGSGNVLVQTGGILSGNGGIGGSVTVAAGGTLAVGNGSDSLTIGNNLTLNAGSLTLLQIRHSPPTNSSVNVGNNLVYGGTLAVTNLGGVLANGDSFQLFSSANFSGTFTNLALPALTNGLFWDTNLLYSDGILSVATTIRPVIGSITVAGSRLTLTGTGGVAGANWYLLATTNLTTALTNWIRIATNQYDVNGKFSLTIFTVTNSLQGYYLIQSP